MESLSSQSASCLGSHIYVFDVLNCVSHETQLLFSTHANEGTTNDVAKAPNLGEYRELMIRRKLLGGSLNTSASLPLGPPGPSADWLEYEQDVAKALQEKLNMIGTPFSASHAMHEKISHMACNYERWPVENGYFNATWQKFRAWTFNSEKGAGFYRVTGDAGRNILYMDELLNTQMRIVAKDNPDPIGIPMSPSCGYRQGIYTLYFRFICV